MTEIHIEQDKKNWVKTIDDALSKVDNDWTEWTKDGIVLLNGATWEDNSRGYRYLQLGQYKLVQVDLKISTPNEVKTDSIDIASIPDDISADGLDVYLGTTNWLGNLGRSGASEFIQDKVLKVSLLSTTAPTNGWSTSVWGSAIYVSNDSKD